jgi:hypothetical protein
MLNSPPDQGLIDITSEQDEGYHSPETNKSNQKRSTWRTTLRRNQLPLIPNRKLVPKARHKRACVMISVTNEEPLIKPTKAKLRLLNSGNKPAQPFILVGMRGELASRCDYGYINLVRCNEYRRPKGLVIVVDEVDAEYGWFVAED